MKNPGQVVRQGRRQRVHNLIGNDRPHWTNHLLSTERATAAWQQRAFCVQNSIRIHCAILWQLLIDATCAAAFSRAASAGTQAGHLFARRTLLGRASTRSEARRKAKDTQAQEGACDHSWGGIPVDACHAHLPGGSPKAICQKRGPAKSLHCQASTRERPTTTASEGSWSACQRAAWPSPPRADQVRSRCRIGRSAEHISRLRGVRYPRLPPAAYTRLWDWRRLRWCACLTRMYWQ